MTSDEFLVLMDKSLDRQVRLLSAKGDEYQGGSDRLGNFKQVGELLSIPPIHVLLVYAEKHWRSIVRYATTGVEGAEPIEGRVDDLCNYLHLLLGLIEEKKHAGAGT